MGSRQYWVLCYFYVQALGPGLGVCLSAQLKMEQAAPGLTLLEVPFSASVLGKSGESCRVQGEVRVLQCAQPSVCLLASICPLLSASAL